MVSLNLLFKLYSLDTHHGLVIVGFGKPRKYVHGLQDGLGVLFQFFFDCVCFRLPSEIFYRVDLSI